MKSEEKVKKSKKERQKELRNDGFTKVGGINFDQVVDRQVGDKRFERERDYQKKIQEEGVGSLFSTQPTVSSTFDAFKRIAAGLEGRTIADKISDSNRPTWEQYKKDNEDKLDNVGGEVRKMIEYRAQLDREREQKLGMISTKNLKNNDSTDSDDDDNKSVASNGSSNAKKKKKKDKKTHKKEKKKHKKSKKRSREEEVPEEGYASSSADSVSRACIVVVEK